MHNCEIILLNYDLYFIILLKLTFEYIFIFRLAEAFAGASHSSFPREVCDVLMSPVNKNDVEIKPEGKFMPITCQDCSISLCSISVKLLLYLLIVN